MNLTDLYKSKLMENYGDLSFTTKLKNCSVMGFDSLTGVKYIDSDCDMEIYWSPDMEVREYGIKNFEINIKDFSVVINWRIYLDEIEESDIEKLKKFGGSIVDDMIEGEYEIDSTDWEIKYQLSNSINDLGFTLYPTDAYIEVDNKRIMVTF